MRGFRSLLTLAFALSVSGAASTAQAQLPGKTVVELFTSQGCSSCPPADALLKSYASRDDVIALSFNVDYWDYLGWKDTLGKRTYSERQQGYARSRGDGQVYTPQVVVNGRIHAIGSVQQRIDEAISEARSTGPTGVNLKVGGDKGAVTIKVSGDTDVLKSATIWIAAVTPSVTVEVKRGENGGHRLTYYNVVRQLMPVGMWSDGELIIRVNRNDVFQRGINRCAVLVQAPNTGPILAAQWLPNG